MSKSITQKMKYKQSVIKYSYKHGVKKHQFNLMNGPKRYIDREKDMMEVYKAKNDIWNDARKVRNKI